MEVFKHKPSASMPLQTDHRPPQQYTLLHVKHMNMTSMTSLKPPPKSPSDQASAGCEESKATLVPPVMLPTVCLIGIQISIILSCYRNLKFGSHFSPHLVFQDTGSDCMANIKQSPVGKHHRV